MGIEATISEVYVKFCIGENHILLDCVLQWIFENVYGLMVKEDHQVLTTEYYSD